MTTPQIEIPEPIETLTDRLRAAADDIHFQGRPDPHDDKALLREAAAEIESLQRSVAGYRMWASELGQHIIAAHAPGKVDEDAVAILDGYHVGAREVAGGGADEPGEHTLGAALRLLKLALERGAFFPAHTVLQPLGDCLNQLMADPALDIECFPLKPDGSRQLEGEGGIEMAVRLLKLAARRGAFARGKHIETEDGPMLLMQGQTPGMIDLLGRLADMNAGLHEPHQQNTIQAAIDALRRLLPMDPASLASWIVNSLGFEMRLWTADNGGGFALVNPEALTDCIRRAIETAPSKGGASEPTQATLLCTGDVAPGEAAVDTRFVELFYLSGPRVGLRFNGLPDVYIPDADAHTIAKTLLSGGEHSEPSWKVIRRAAEYFGQRIHVDSARGKLVLTEGRDAYLSPKGQARRALERLGPIVLGGGTFKLAAAVSIGPACGLSIDEFRPLLAAWNEVGSPRWSDEDLEQRLVDRYAQLKADFGQDLLDRGADRGPVAGPRETPDEPSAA